MRQDPGCDDEGIPRVADNLPSDKLTPIEAKSRSGTRLSARGTWLLIALAVSLAGWAVIAWVVARLAAP